MESATWCEIDDHALHANIEQLKHRLGTDTLLGVVVKGDAYGHGLLDCARAFCAAGADWLVVHSHAEAVALRNGGLQETILVCGPTQPVEAGLAAKVSTHVVVYDAATVRALGLAAAAKSVTIPVHVKIETGTNRQGLRPEDLCAFVQLVKSTAGVFLQGASTHFADVEDDEDHDFARQQLAVLDGARQQLATAGLSIPMWHAAASAAALLLPKSRLDLVRVGIAAYGLWPSGEIERLVAASENPLELQPALSWRARIAQVQKMSAGGSVGYGRTWYAGGARRRIAVLPVGYHEGFPRSRSNQGHVLIRGLPAPVRGRVCMNLVMVEVTDIEAATGSALQAGEVATLLGADGDANITAAQFADWSSTIHYEIISRIHPCVPRHRVAQSD
jgi:alanine racemase